jgi:hypothetical protein
MEPQCKSYVAAILRSALDILVTAKEPVVRFMFN